MFDSNHHLRKSIVNLLLLIIIVAGLGLRTSNVNFDAGTNSHPDERSTTCFYAPSIGMPQSWDEFKDPQRSPMNPLWDLDRQSRRSFTYGHFPLYLGILFGEFLHKLAPLAESLSLAPETVQVLERANTACNGIAVPGRLMIAMLDTLTIFFLFLLGRRLGARRDESGQLVGGAMLGILAAAFYAFTAQAIQLSHFFAMDPASTTFTVLAVYGAVRMVQDRTLGAALLTGIGIGLAVSSKFSALPILAAPVTAGILVFWNDSIRTQLTNPDERVPHRGREQFRTLLSVPLVLLIGAIVFAVTSPYAILDWESFVNATLVEQGRMVRGIADFPFTRQYRNTAPYIYFLEQQYFWGMGAILGTITYAGCALMLLMLIRSMWKLFTGHIETSAESRPKWLSDMEVANVVAWSWVVPYFGLTGAFLAKFNRYMSPVLPFIALFGAALLYLLWGQRHTVRRQLLGENEDEIPAPQILLDLRRVLATVIALVGIGAGLFWSAAYVNGVYNTDHPWITASRWIYNNVEPNSVILWELWDDALPKALHSEPGMNMGEKQLRNTDWGPYEEESVAKYELLKTKLREVDYVSYSSKRIYDSVDELPGRYPMTTRYYEAMWSGELGFEMALDVTTPPSLWGYTFEDRGADESWSLYDHPQVTLFRKTRDLSDAEFDAIFERSWENAEAYYRGPISPISPFLEAVGLGQSSESEKSGLINRLVGLATGEDGDAHGSSDDETEMTLLFEQPISELAVVDNYRWNEAASQSTLMSSLWWWAVLALLGWLAWPICFFIFRPLRDRGYMLSRTFGWLLASWMLWILASQEWALNSVRNSWWTVGLLGMIGLGMLFWQRREIGRFLRKNFGLIVVGELVFAAAYVGFIYVRIQNPDIWQPWYGGEKFMEFAFLNGILRSPYFPPVDPHFAGGYINYYYFGIYMVGYLIKLTGIYAEVAFNLAIATLFALTVSNAYAIAYSAVRNIDPRRQSANRTSGAITNAARLLPAPADEPSATAQPTTPPVPAYSTLTEIATVEIAAVQMPRTHAASATASAKEYEDVDLSGLSTMETKADITADTGIDAARTDIARTDTKTDIAREASDSHDPSQPRYSNVVRLGDYDAGRSVRNDGNDTRVDAGSSSRSVVYEEHELPWYRGLGVALLGPFFVTLLGNLDGFAQIIRKLQNMSVSDFQSGLPLLPEIVHAWSGYQAMREAGGVLPGYDFWGPSRVIPNTINEFPFWSFLFADLHPHLIGIPLSVFFLALIFVLLKYSVADRDIQIGRGIVLLLVFALMLGTLASVNLWEFPTYLGLGVLAFVMSRYRQHRRIDLPLTALVSVLYVGLSYLIFLPFFQNYKNVGASGIGTVRAPDPPGVWLLIWGFFGFILLTWVVLAAGQSARRTRVRAQAGEEGLWGQTVSGSERWLSVLLNKFSRLPRFVYLHRLLTKQSEFGYLLLNALIPLTMFAAVGALLWGRTVLALCLFPLGLVFLLLWRRGRAADSASLFMALLTVTGLAILAGTQIIFLKDFLQGGDVYRMNTLFKFFNQVWVLWALASAIAVPRIWQMMNAQVTRYVASATDEARSPIVRTGRQLSPIWQTVWSLIFSVLLVSSFAYIIFGTPARLQKRMMLGVQPEIGTINGLDFMREGIYTWPDSDNAIELSYDWEAINWLLDNVRGNAVIVESSEIDYYRAGGTRVASMTGLSGLRGSHEQEQRYGSDVGLRGAQHIEFWDTPDWNRTEELINELDIALIYVGQLERFKHEAGVQKIEAMAADNRLQLLYSNERVDIYGVPEQISTWLQPDDAESLSQG